jgi:hypothetical protein
MIAAPTMLPPLRAPVIDQEWASTAALQHALLAAATASLVADPRQAPAFVAQAGSRARD